MEARHLFLLLFTLAITPIAKAETISAAVASNFTEAMKAIAYEFEIRSGHQVQLSFGSSGKFYAQIKQGAPYELFFSADQLKPALLEQEGLTAPGSRFTYAIGTLALWSADPTKVDAEAKVLTEGDFKKLAIANPKLAPYGAAAIETLQALGIESSTRNKLVQGENIAQAYQFAATGNAELGLVALSQIIDEGKIKTGSAWIVPANLYTPIRQDAVLLRHAEQSKAARQLLAFVRSEQARALIATYGYQAEQ